LRRVLECVVAGKPTPDARIQGFYRKFRAERLDGYHSGSLARARTLIAD
jgi:hypothetical protein